MHVYAVTCIFKLKRKFETAGGFKYAIRTQNPGSYHSPKGVEEPVKLLPMNVTTSVTVSSKCHNKLLYTRSTDKVI